MCYRAVTGGHEHRAARAPTGDDSRARGWYDIEDKSIVVITGETTRAQIFKTLVHELGHAILHGANDHHAAPVQEVEAESTAFVVCSALGLDSSDFSFPYVTLWSRGEDAQAMVLRSGDRIVRAANRILKALIPDEEPEDAGALPPTRAVDDVENA